jgi:cobalt-zinc-cadmium efflux system outer membrane protein
MKSGRLCVSKGLPQFLLYLFLTTPWPLQSAEPLTLSAALRLAEQQHPALQAGAARIDTASAAIQTARARLNPDAALLAGKQTQSGSPSNGVPFIAFTQPLELGQLRPTRIQVAEKGRESATHALEEIRLAVLSQVRRTFYMVLRREGEIEIASENLRLAEDLRNRIQVRVDVGEVGRLELIRAEAEVASARTQVAGARLQRVGALAQFRAATGGIDDDDIRLQGELDPLLTLPPVAEFRRQALASHPALAVMRSEVSRAEARIEYEKALRRPQPAFRVEVDMSGPSYRAGLAIPLPTRNRREGPIAEAVADLRTVNSVARARELDILTALEGAYERYIAAGQQVSLFGEGLSREAEAALRAAESAYQLGERGILDVLDAQRLLRSVRLNLLGAQYDRQAALIDLDELRARDLRSNP